LRNGVKSQLRKPIRLAQPIDIARVVMFFAQENLFVSGQTLIVDGGSTV